MKFTGFARETNWATFFSFFTKTFFKPKQKIKQKHSIRKPFYFSQRHQFDAIYFPTVGYRLKLQELTDGGDYTCHANFDQSHEFDYHFIINIDRELKKGRGYVKIIKNENNSNQIAINVTDATDAPIGVNKFLTTAIRKPHLIATKSSNRNSIVASNSMVKRTTGDGHSSIQKRHINSFDTTTVSTPFTTTTATIVTTAPPTTTSSSSSSKTVLHSNKQQHSTLSDLELSTTTAEIPTTIVPLPRDNPYPMVLPYSMGKRKGWSIRY